MNLLSWHGAGFWITAGAIPQGLWWLTSQFIGDRRVQNGLQPLERPRDIGSVHDAVVVVNAHIDRAVPIDFPIVQEGGQRRKGIERFGAEAGIYR